MNGLIQDLRIALRALVNNPAFSAVVMVMLGLGIGSNATVFGWLYAVLMRPLPGVVEPGELAMLEAVESDGRRLVEFTHPDFRDYQRQLTLASGVAATHLAFFSIGPPEENQRVVGQVVSANFFSVLGVRPYRGRLLAPEEDVDVPGAFPIVVVSHRLWKSQFHGDEAAVGRAVRLNGHTYTLVGVTPPAFHGSVGAVSLDVWVPLSRMVETGHLNTWAAKDYNARFLELVVRRKPGVSIAQADQEARAVAARIAATRPETHGNTSARAVPLSESQVGLQGSLGYPLRILIAVCGLVLLIACANVANLMMARSITRQREFAIRAALGSSAARMVRLVVMESLLLSGAGAVVGVLLSQWLGETILYFLPSLSATVRQALGPSLTVSPDGMVFLYSALTATAAAILSALTPALYAARVGPAQSMRESGRSSSPGHSARRSSTILVIGEVALAALAVSGAVILAYGFRQLTKVDLGFQPDHVLVAQFHLSTNGYSLKQEKQFSRELRRRLEAAPGIEAVSYAHSIPLSLFGAENDRVQDPASGVGQGKALRVAYSVVAPGYFRLMGIPLLAGRDFDENDDLTREAVIIVNQSFVRRYLGNSDPIGRKLQVSGRQVRIAGVAKDSKYKRHGEGPTPLFYGAFAQMFWSGHNHFVLIRAASLSMAREVLRREVAALDSSQNLYELATLSEHTENGLFTERVAAGLLSVVAALALLLAVFGLYSVLAYHVSERTREIGIRMALGAGHRVVLKEFFLRGLALTAAGLALGAAGAFAAARLLAAFLAPVLTNVEWWPVLISTTAVLLGPAVLAGLIPAWRATRVDPVTALRAE